MIVVPARRRVLPAFGGVTAGAVTMLASFVALLVLACGSTTSTPAPSANEGGTPANDAATAEGGTAPDSGKPSCDGKASTCPFVGPGFPGMAGASPPITDPSACGVSPFGVDAGTTCEAFCKAQNPGGQTVHCVSSDPASGAFTCSCSMIP